MSNGARDVVVIGAGIVGSLTSYLLSKRGMKVTMLEADAIGNHASGLAYGGLDPLSGIGLPEPLLDFSLHCFQRHWDIAPELREASGVDSQLRSRDRLYLAFNDDDCQQHQDNLAWMKDVSAFDIQWADGSAVLELEPKVNPECVGAIYQRGAASLDAYSLTLGAARSAEKHGTEIRLQRVTGLEHRGGRVAAVVCQEERIEAGAVVVAMGPWSRQISGWCGFDLPVQPLKGQILRLQYDGPPFNIGLNYQGDYVDSKADGLVWTGSTEEEAGFEADPDSGGRDTILVHLSHIAPGLAGAKIVKHTACLRPVTPDGIPAVGRLPGWDNLYVATGAGRKGILWSTGMCDIVAELVAEGETQVAGAQHLAPARFGRD